MPDFTGTVDGGVERDFNLDPPRRAMNVDPLIGVELCRAGERGGPSAKIQRGRCQAVCAQLLVELHNAGNPLWFRSKDKAREGNRVTANIHQSAASDVALIADVARVVVEVGEERLDRAQVANCSFLYQFFRQLPLRMMAVHEGFHHLDFRMSSRAVEQLLAFGRREPDRFLA